MTQETPITALYNYLPRASARTRATPMADKPIMFSKDMILAILAGKKCQTRRVLTPGRKCRFSIGDRLWVKEGWQFYDWTKNGTPYIRYRADNKILLRETTDEWEARLKLPHVSTSAVIWGELSRNKIDGRAADHKWRSALFMPRWAARLSLKVTAVRTQRLQEISKRDAIEEGFGWFYEPVVNFAAYWDSINKRFAWGTNPIVEAVTFEVGNG
jgi:hypothetical protein